MSSIISLFNHKGGVSKTTTVFNLGWMLAEKGKRVLIVDTDPQCNLTGLCLNLSGLEDLNDFYENSGYDNIKSVLSPVFEGIPKGLEPANCFPIPNRPNLFLLAGHIDFSEYDVSIGIAQELTGSLKFTQNIPGSLSHMLRLTAEEFKLDYILIDMSPSVSATNANILMQSDYFLVPCTPDYFCNMAIHSLSNILPSWSNTYNNLRNHPMFSRATYRVPDTSPKFIGTIFQRYRPRNGFPVKSFQRWINEITYNVNNQLVPMLQKNNLIIEKEKFETICSFEEPYNILNISDFNSLIAQSQKYNVPVYSLNHEQIEQQGNVLKAMIKNRNDFHSTFNSLADSVILLTN